MKLTKRELKQQQEIFKLLDKEILTDEDKDTFYENFNPGYIDNLEQGVFFTPYGLAQDCAVFSYRHGHVLDLCAGIGMLSYRVKEMDTYNKEVKSITCIEMNPKFVEIGKKLLPEANWICASVFEDGLIERLLEEKGIDRFDSIISNPPFGKIAGRQEIERTLNYTGKLDLMVLELCIRYGKNGYFIVPPTSAPFRYSGSQYYKEEIARDLEKFIRMNKEFVFNLSCDGIDCKMYVDEWKNTNVMVECMNVDIFPFSMCDERDSITRKVK